MLLGTGKLLRLAVLGSALAFMAAPVEAAPIRTMPLQAEITFINNATGIAVGDIATGSVSWDEGDRQPAGAGQSYYGITAISLSFPDTTNSPSDISVFAPTSLTLDDRIFFLDATGEFFGIVINGPTFDAWGVDDATFAGYLGTTGRDFFLTDGSFNGIGGTLSAVPLPAAAWLFLGGLAALAGIRRRGGAAQA